MKEIIFGVISTIVAGIILLLLEHRTKWFGHRDRIRQETEDVLPPQELGAKSFAKRTFKFKAILSALILIFFVGAIFVIWRYNRGFFKHETVIEFSEIPSVIQELVKISDTYLLKTQLNEYNKQGVLAVGKKDDFGNHEGFFVFLVDETQVYGTFLFKNSRFFDLRTKAEVFNIPEQFSDKQQIWVIEAYRLVQK